MTAVLRRYNRGRKLVSVTDAIAGTKSVYHFDHQGSTQCLTDATTGAVTARFSSDAWGVTAQQSGSTLNRQWYIGNLGYSDSLAGQLTYVRARYLLPSTGSWLSFDRSKSDPSAYGYVRNAPVAHVDPTGLLGCNPWGERPESRMRSWCLAEHGVSCCCREKPRCQAHWLIGNPDIIYSDWGDLEPFGNVENSARCRGCAVTELGAGTSVKAYCERIKSWADSMPEGEPNGWWALWNGLWVVSMRDQAERDCRDRRNQEDEGHCAHCMASCLLARNYGAIRARWIGWCKELRDLSDCSSQSQFSTRDMDVNMEGINGTGATCRDVCSRHFE